MKRKKKNLHMLLTYYYSIEASKLPFSIAIIGKLSTAATIMLGNLRMVDGLAHGTLIVLSNT